MCWKTAPQLQLSARANRDYGMSEEQHFECLCFPYLRVHVYTPELLFVISSVSFVISYNMLLYCPTFTVVPFHLVPWPPRYQSLSRFPFPSTSLRPGFMRSVVSNTPVS